MDGITLDHVAVALERWTDAFPRFAIELGGVWKSGGWAPGFAPGQVAYANDMRVELLEPNDVEHNDFLRRFLDRHGPGPHHYTFKVDDLDAALEAIAAAGFTPVGVDRRDEEWQEAFLHPKDTNAGIVIQVAEAKGPEWKTPPPDGFPSAAEQRPSASLVDIVHGVTDLAAGYALFGDLLGGRASARGDDWVELAWPGPGRIRLVTAERPGLQHLVFAGPREVSPRALEADTATGTRIVIEPGD